MKIEDQIRIYAITAKHGINLSDYIGKGEGQIPATIQAIKDKPEAFMEYYYPKSIKPTAGSYLADVWSQTKGHDINHATALVQNIDHWQAQSKYCERLKLNLYNNADTIGIEICAGVAAVGLGVMAVPAAAVGVTVGVTGTIGWVAIRSYVESFAPQINLPIAPSEMELFEKNIQKYVEEAIAANIKPLIDNIQKKELLKKEKEQKEKEQELEQLNGYYESAVGVVLIGSAIIRLCPGIKVRADKIQAAGLKLCEIGYTAAKLYYSLMNPILALGTIANGISEFTSLFKQPDDPLKGYFDRLFDELEDIKYYLNAEFSFLRGQLEIIDKKLDGIKGAQEDAIINGHYEDREQKANAFHTHLGKIKSTQNYSDWSNDFYAYFSDIKLPCFTGFYFTSSISMYDWSRWMNLNAKIQNIIGLISLIPKKIRQRTIESPNQNITISLSENDPDPKIPNPLLWRQMTLCYLGAELYVTSENPTGSRNHLTQQLMDDGVLLKGQLKRLVSNENIEFFRVEYLAASARFGYALSNLDLTRIMIAIPIPSESECIKSYFFRALWNEITKNVNILKEYKTLESLATFLRALTLLEAWLNKGASSEILKIGFLDSVISTDSQRFHVNLHDFADIADILLNVVIKNQETRVSPINPADEVQKYFNSLAPEPEESLVEQLVISTLSENLNPIEETIVLLEKYQTAVNANDITKLKEFWSSSHFSKSDAKIEPMPTVPNTHVPKMEMLRTVANEKMYALQKSFILALEIIAVVKELGAFEQKMLNHLNKANSKIMNVSIEKRIILSDAIKALVDNLQSSITHSTDSDPIHASGEVLSQFNVNMSRYLEPLKNKLTEMSKQAENYETLLTQFGFEVGTADYNNHLFPFFKLAKSSIERLVQKASCAFMYFKLEAAFLLRAAEELQAYIAETSSIVDTAAASFSSAPLQFCQEPNFKPRIDMTLPNYNAPVQVSTFLLDGRLVVAARSACIGSITLWDVSTSIGKPVATLTGHSGPKCAVLALAILPDGCLVSGSQDKTIRIWDVSSGICIAVLTGHTDSINTLVVLKNGNIVSGSNDNTIRIWDALTTKCIAIYSENNSPVRALTLLPNGQLVSGSNDNIIRIWDISTGRCTSTLMGHTSFVLALTVLSNGRLASGSNDKTVRIWDMPSGKCILILVGHSFGVQSIAELPNGFLSSADTTAVRMWNVKKHRYARITQPVSTLQDPKVHPFALASLSDGRLMVGTQIWDLGFRLMPRAIVPLSLRQNIHTLFGHGYRFSTTASHNELSLQAILPSTPSSSTEVLLGCAETEFQQVVSARPEHPMIVNQGNHRWLVQSGNPAFIAQMKQELQEMVTETSGVSCTIS